MATITFSIADLKRLSGTEGVEEVVHRLGMSVEESKDGSITIDVTPNRPDLLDIHGMARAIANFAGVREPREKFYRMASAAVLEISVEKGVGKLRPCIAGMVARNLDLTGDNLTYMINFLDKIADTYGRKRRKIAVGINDLSKVRGALRYTAAKEGKLAPLGSTKRMGFAEILAKSKKGLQYGQILEGARSYPVLYDSEKVIALIPIISSEETKITQASKEVVIDVTGTSQYAVNQMAGVIACALIDAGADVYPVNIKYPNGKTTTSPELEYREAEIKLTKIDRTIGNLLSEADLVKLANRMGYTGYKYGDSIVMEVPPYRVDFLNYQDAIEDLVIAYGYDRIKPLPVIGTAQGVPNEISTMERALAVLLVGMGFTEAYNNYLTNEKVCFDNMQRSYREENVIKVAYSKTESLTMMRDSLLPGLLENLARSAHEKMPQRLFEVGNTFELLGGKAIESLRIAFVSEHSRANFSEAKGYAECLFRHLGMAPVLQESGSKTFLAGRCANVTLVGNIVGTFGELNPEVLEAFRLEEPTVACEIVIIREIPYFKES